MQQVLALILAPLKWLAGLLLPIFTRPRIPPVVFWIVHVLLVLAVLFGLWYLHNETSYGPTLRQWMPKVGGKIEWLGQNYLVVFALLIYVLAWIVVGLWKIWLEEDANQGQFPDLDEAWQSILEALHQNGIRFDDAPLFLIVGQAEMSLERLFKGLPRESTLTGITPSTAPLRIFGGRDALYLACPGVSLLAKALGFGPGGDVGGAGLQMVGTKTIGAEDDLTKSMGADAEEVARIIRAARQEGRGVSDDERSQLRNISLADSQSDASALRPNVVQSPEAVSLHEARMKYFCQLLAKARWPYCGVNGAALLFSLRVSENEGNAQKIALAAQKDVKTLSEGLKLQFPTFVLLSDIDKWTGAASFLARFPEEKRKNRLGRGFPLAPDVATEKYPALVERDVAWIFDHLLPYWSFRFLRLETPNVESPEEAVQSNAEIFRFLAQSQQRAATIARMVAKALEPDEGSLPLLGGCYVVAQSAGQPWFTQDLFTKLEGAQDFVSWTQVAFDEDDDYKAWTWYGYGFLILIWLLLAGLAYYWYSQKSST